MENISPGLKFGLLKECVGFGFCGIWILLGCSQVCSRENHWQICENMAAWNALYIRNLVYLHELVVLYVVTVFLLKNLHFGIKSDYYKYSGYKLPYITLWTVSLVLVNRCKYAGWWRYGRSPPQPSLVQLHSN